MGEYGQGNKVNFNELNQKYIGTQYLLRTSPGGSGNDSYLTYWMRICELAFLTHLHTYRICEKVKQLFLSEIKSEEAELFTISFYNSPG